MGKRAEFALELANQNGSLPQWHAPLDALLTELLGNGHDVVLKLGGRAHQDLEILGC